MYFTNMFHPVPLTDIQRIIKAELLCKSRLLQGDGSFRDDNVYIHIIGSGWQGMKVNDFYVQTAGAEGGAWENVGTGTIHDDMVVLKIKTLHGIFTSQHTTEKFIFSACVPGYPDNIMPFLERVTLNYRRAKKLARKRYWKRDLRKEKAKTKKQQAEYEALYEINRRPILATP